MAFQGPWGDRQGGNVNHALTGGLRIHTRDLQMGGISKCFGEGHQIFKNCISKDLRLIYSLISGRSQGVSNIRIRGWIDEMVQVFLLGGQSDQESHPQKASRKFLNFSFSDFGRPSSHIRKFHIQKITDNKMNEKLKTLILSRRSGEL